MHRQFKWMNSRMELSGQMFVKDLFFHFIFCIYICKCMFWEKQDSLFLLVTFRFSLSHMSVILTSLFCHRLWMICPLTSPLVKQKEEGVCLNNYWDRVRSSFWLPSLFKKKTLFHNLAPIFIPSAAEHLIILIPAVCQQEHQHHRFILHIVFKAAICAQCLIKTRQVL